MKISQMTDSEIDAEIEKLSREVELADTEEAVSRLESDLDAAYDERDARDEYSLAPHDEHVGIDVPAGYAS